MDFYSYLWLRKNDLPYYVGKGTGDRAYHSVRGHRPPKNKSRIVIFPQDNEADAIESEKCLIALFGRKDQGTGCLRNQTDGGDGVSGYRFSEKAKQRMSIIHANPSAEIRDRISKALKGRPLAEQTKRKMSAVRKGKKKSAEWRAKISASHVGKIVSTAAKQNMSDAAKRRGWSPQAIEKMALANFIKTVAWG